MCVCKQASSETPPTCTLEAGLLTAELLMLDFMACIFAVGWVWGCVKARSKFVRRRGFCGAALALSAALSPCKKQAETHSFPAELCALIQGTQIHKYINQ